MATSFLESPEVAPLVDACVAMLALGLEFTYLDFKPEVGMTEELFTVIMEELAAEVNQGHPSTVH